MMPSPDPQAALPAEPTNPLIPPLPMSAPPVRPPAPSRRRTLGLIALLFAGLLTTFGSGLAIGLTVPPAVDPPPVGAAATNDEFALISQAWDTIHSQYVDRANLDDKALAYGAISGMATAVGDTGHTSFLTPDDLKARHNELSGSYVGIGVRVEAATDGRPRIVGVFDGSPAAGAGIKAGDVISSVDGKTSTGVALDTVISWIRGASGSTVVVTVQADGTGPDRTYTITRADVPVQPVTWTIVPGTRTAVLRLEQFSTGAADDVVKALKALEAAGADRLILDLRDNPGGYVNEAVGLASQFLSTGDVYIERDANGKETHNPVTSGGVALDLPMVVLVDAGTASSAEIATGALQDAKRATVVGVTTFGTGTVLGEFPLKDGSALRIGTVEWLTPSGRRIWHAGIKPDVTVDRPTDVAPITPDDLRDLTPAAVDAIKDPQMTKALSVVAGLK